MMETGLGVIRSLARHGIPVSGADHKFDMAFRSRYVSAVLCPHPERDTTAFIDWMLGFAEGQQRKPVLFLTSDDFIAAVAEHRETLEELFLLNLPDKYLLDRITSKQLLAEDALSIGIPVPTTAAIQTPEDLQATADLLRFPVFLKGLSSRTWREVYGGTLKGFVVHRAGEMRERAQSALKKGVPLLAQEVVQGPDSNHWKVCVYLSPSGELLRLLTLRKLRQHPPHFGIGSITETRDNAALAALGKRYFEGLGYRGVGSAEFKLDTRDGRWKLIELNPRYWQQNAQATAAGSNFPLTQYMDLTGQVPPPDSGFFTGVKWVNIYMDFSSFLAYRREEGLGFIRWLASLRGRRTILSDFSLLDPGPFLHEIRYGAIFPRALWRIIRLIFRSPKPIR